jgi:hypothetical protein
MTSNEASSEGVILHQHHRWTGARLVAALAALALAASACTAARDGEPTETSQGRPLEPYSGPALQTKETALGAKWDWSRVDSFTPFLKGLPGGATFYELVWCNVEPQPGQRNWSDVDRVVNSTRQLGYQLYLKIRVGSCWATNGRGGHVRGKKRKTASAMPTDLARYHAFVDDAVRRYAAMGVHEYAVENEPNAANFWEGTPEELERLVVEAAAAIREADPKGLVVDPGVSSTAYGVAIAKRLLDNGKPREAVAAYQHYYARRFPVRGRKLPQVSDEGELRAALQGEQAATNLAYLQLADRLAARKVVDIRQLHFYESWDNVPALLDYLKASLPPRFPVQAWEVGMFWVGGADQPDARADEVVKTVSSLLAGQVRPVIWLPLAFDPGGRHTGEPRYGLLDPDGAVRPAGDAVRSIAAAAGQASSVRAVRTSSVSGVAFGGAGRTTLVVWSDGGEAIVSPPPGENAKAETVAGESLAWGSDGLRLDAKPVLLTVPIAPDHAVRLLG